MKKTILLLFFCTFISKAISQEASVEKQIFGIQTGFLGIWGYSESRIADAFTLRGEIGLNTGVYGNDESGVEGFLLAPEIGLDHRWYYNLKKRVEKSKGIGKNSADFISIKIAYHPDWFYISDENNIDLISDISVVPTWGMRRKFSKYFNIEFGLGVGYYRLLEDHQDIDDQNGVAVNLHLRFGFDF